MCPPGGCRIPRAGSVVPLAIVAHPIVMTRQVELRASAREVWPLLSATDRVNRWIGLPAVKAVAVAPGGTSAARFVVETKSGGVPTKYEELPFEWTHERSFRVRRNMIGGPLEGITMAFELEPHAKDKGTRLTLTLEATPRYTVLRPFARIAGGNTLKRMIELAEAVDAHIAQQEPSPYLRPASPHDPRVLEVGVTALVGQGIDRELAVRVGDYVAHCPDADAIRMRPFEVADTWEADRMSVLRAFLHAVPAGLVELRWGVVCPSCRTASSELASLDELSVSGHCQLCDITFELELDRAVEATFVPHQSLRVVPEQMFCIGGPARTPHVLAQALAPRHGKGTLTAPHEAGRYRLFARGGATCNLEIEADAPSDVSLEVDDAAARPAQLRVAPGGSVEVKNASGEDRHVKIEHLAYASTAATAHVVSTMSDFRRVFSKELVKPGTPLKVARVAILFSDLTGSTALYTKVGDAAAFRLVDDHFDILRKAIAAHEGTVVKTMGDAVLAAFIDPRRCARAAIEALRAFESFRATREHGPLVGLKLGMHAGPCYVVTANGVLDYFGQTVNVASRVQHLAQSGELVLPQEIVAELGDEDLAGMRVVERFETRVKGVEKPLELLRLHLTASRLPPAS